MSLTREENEALEGLSSQLAMKTLPRFAAFYAALAPRSRKR